MLNNFPEDEVPSAIVFGVLVVVLTALCVIELIVG